MQTPAYCPEVRGVKPDDQRGVVVDVKNVIGIELVPIVVILEDDIDVGMELDMVSVADAAMSIDTDMSILNNGRSFSETDGLFGKQVETR